MNLHFNPPFRKMLQQVVVIGVLMIMIIGGTNIRIVGLTTRIMFVGVLLAALVMIGSRRLRDARLLLSPMDVGWLALILLTGATVVLAPFPRRSAEVWVLTVGMQLPMAYATIYVFRRGWPERSVYRALLVVGGYLYFVSALATFAYILAALSARASGSDIGPLRVWSVLDNPSVLAMFIAVSVPCMIGHLFMQTRRLERFAGLLWLLGALIATVASGTRSGSIAAVIGSGVALWLALLAHPKRPLASLQNWMAAHRRAAAAFASTGLVVFAVVLAGILYVQTNAPNHAELSDRIELYDIAVNSFLSQPLNAEGPGGFVLAQELVHSTPRYQLVPHAHNLILNVVAENGLLGLIGLFIFLFVGARECVIAWKRAPERRPLLAGAIGGLVGFLASGLFESPMSQPGLFFLASALLMLIVARWPAPDRAAAWRVALIIVPIIIIIALSLVLLVPYNSFWKVVYVDVSPTSDDPTVLRGAASELDSIASLDPYDPLYNLQDAYVWARLATIPSGDPAELDKAIARLERAIQYDPNFGIHYLNLSTLYWKAGRQADALQAAKRASILSYADPAVWLNLGLQLEATADLANAQAAYVESMRIEPRWSGSYFWHGSPVRQAALAQYQQTVVTPYREFDDLIAAGDVARSSGQTAEASRAYEQAAQSTKDAARVSLAQGLLALTKGDLPSAQRLLKNAAAIGDYPSLDMQIYLGDLAGAQGQEDEMLSAYQQVYQSVASRGYDGLGTANSVAYSNTSFWRVGLVSPYLPDVLTLDITPLYAARFKVLAQATAADGNSVEAARIYRAILRANPSDTEALLALRRLKS